MKIILSLITVIIIGTLIYQTVNTNQIKVQSTNQYTGPNPQSYVIR